MTTTQGQYPFIVEWIEEKLGKEFLKQTNLLSKSQRDQVRRMMSPKKFSQLVAGLPTRWSKLSELEKIAKELFGDISFTRALFFHPKRNKIIVEAIFEHIND